MAENGKLPPEDLAPIAQGELAKANACAASWNAMNQEARDRGIELIPTGPRSSYRSYEEQQQLYQDYLNGGNLAAVPGTSNHGWGYAVDVATTQMRDMIDQIGHKYGWAKEWSDAPSEWWHLKHKPGVWSGPDPGPHGQAPDAADYHDITSTVSSTGALHVFVEHTDGSIWYTWQPAGKTAWNDGQAGQRIAGLTKFAPAP